MGDRLGFIFLSHDIFPSIQTCSSTSARRSAHPRKRRAAEAHANRILATHIVIRRDHPHRCRSPCSASRHHPSHRAINVPRLVLEGVTGRETAEVQNCGESVSHQSRMKSQLLDRYLHYTPADDTKRDPSQLVWLARCLRMFRAIII
jgi:hypothetical protein